MPLISQAAVLVYTNAGSCKGYIPETMSHTHTKERMIEMHKDTHNGEVSIQLKHLAKDGVEV